MKILEEFWYGNIEPTEYDTSSKEYKKLQELICRNEEKLRATMTDEQKERFEKYSDCTIAGTLESIAPEIKELDVTEVMELLEYVFHKEDVQKVVQRMKNAHDLRNRNAKEG